MIEFKGYISGPAEKAFWRKSRKIVFAGYLVVLPAIFPMLFLFGNLFQSKTFVYAFAIFFALVPLTLFIPKGKKEKQEMTPKRIYINGEHIVCVADRYTDSKFISDVKKVIDHGEFYELCFPFGKTSEKFICQKDLLVKGTLEEFEALFEGKSERK